MFHRIKLLSIYAVIATLLCALAIFGEGAYVVYALGGLGFFMSIMFPTIFSLGIEELGRIRRSGVTARHVHCGRSNFPLHHGSVIDMRGDDIQSGYIVPLICFLVILYFGVSGYKIRNHQKPVELD
jgi:FHS family L-fucose permease-like MFS transporter